MSLHLSLSLKVAPAVIRPPETKRLYLLKHDWNMGHVRSCFKADGSPATGCPEVWFFRPNHYSWLTKEWQYFWFRLNGGDPERPAPDDLRAWRGYTASNAYITDAKGPDIYRDWIGRERLSLEDPKIKCLSCGGNVFAGKEVFDRIWYLEPDMLDGTRPPPSFEWIRQNHVWEAVIHDATNTVTGTPIVNPFTHFGGRDTGKPVLNPFVGRMQVRIPLFMLEKLPLGSVRPSPYVPPM